jgi:hypothetical protein
VLYLMILLTVYRDNGEGFCSQLYYNKSIIVDDYFSVEEYEVFQIMKD